MAIILPNTRNSIGYANRYSDLGSAGLQYTPTPSYKYDAYDVQGDEATLYEEDIDLADYQYNLDSDIAQVVPEGYVGASGGTHGYWLVGDDTKLYYRHASTNVIELPYGSPSGVVMVTGGPSSCVTIVGTELKKYTYNAGGVTATAVDNTKEWTYVSGAANDNDFIGVGDGQLWFIDNGITISILNYQVGWKAAAIGNNDLFDYTLGYYWSVAIHPLGYLYRVIGSNPVSQLDLGGGWTDVSGYGHIEDEPVTDTRMYGIRAGELNSISAGGNIATKIGSFTDWWKVVFVAQDEAVAMRRSVRV